MKSCSKCKVEKSFDNFKKVQKGKYYDSWCRSCNSKDSRDRQIRKNAESPGWRREGSRKRKIRIHGISLEEFDRMVQERGGRCEICGTVPDRRLVIDHDHACCPGSTSCGNCIRGLLCGACNSGIGFLRDSLEVTKSAVKYLSKE